MGNSIEQVSPGEPNISALQNTKGASLPRRIFALIACGLFGLALARAAADTAPFIVGPLPRWSLALVSALAFAAVGYRLSLTALPAYIFLPLILPALTLRRIDPNPLRDWLLIFGALGGSAAIAINIFINLKASVDSLLSAAPTNDIRARLFRLLPLAYPVSLGFIVSGLYLRTLAPTVGEADTFEFQVNVIKLGISHGSGYPLYILLAKLFSLLPLGGTTAFRINLSSAFFGVTAVLICYGLARRLNIARPAAWLGALYFGISIGLWSRAVEAEVYTLHVTLVGLLLLLEITALGPSYGHWKLRLGFWDFGIWHLISFLFGLSLANHLTTALLAPALLIAFIYYLAGSYPLNKSSLVALLSRNSLISTGFAILFFALGLSVYLYLPLRWPAVNNGEAMSWDMFMHFFTGAEAQGALRLNAWYTDFSRYAIVGNKVLDQYGWQSVIYVVAALFVHFRLHPKPAAGVISLAAWAAYAFFALCFYVPDPDYSSFLLPAHFIMAVWIAAGIDLGAWGLHQCLMPIIWKDAPSRWAKSVLYCSVFFLVPFMIQFNLPRVDQSNDWQEYNLGKTILSQPLKEGAAILADSQLIAPLYYLQVAEGVRPDLDIIVLPAENYYRAELDARMSAGQPVYLGRYLPHLADAYYLHSVGPLTEAKFEPSPLPTNIEALNATFGDVITLHGFQLDSATIPSNNQLPITLYWQALQPPPANYLVTLRLLDTAGNIALTGPAEVPVGQMYPTAAWPLDDVVADYHAFALDPSLPPGDYQLQVGLFPAFSTDGLLTESGAAWQTLRAVIITPPTDTPQPQRLERIRLADGIWLMGYDAPATVAPGSRLSVTYYWQSSSNVVAQVCLAEVCQPVAVRAGEGLTESKVTFTAPEAARTVGLSVGLPGVKAECSWWFAPPADTCSLTNLSIEGAALAPNAINFDNQIVLDSLKVETPQAGPGQTVIVSAQWHGLKSMSEDYTVFVHLLGPDGMVHGQVDMWPVQGTLPTTQWQVNAPVADRFEVRVPDDAPLGDYKVEVGWYLLATLDRLPVVNANGVAIDDRYLIEGLTIR